ncbi:protein of unknown function [Mucilaginibacter gossypiicola]|uniref:DUF4348 domain-containing protein n=1 Tax=Mucilaginibacter gossypiicola TaxID=551995 RepID=A0A1H8ENJ2_9SPHI|nr:DUF4348 domain-containing protein [Mucilaginibacter gossypiicola]SEN20447.1 protein of unknown function [Mucilaginibacter gossypiicola]
MLYQSGGNFTSIIATTALILFCSLKTPVKQLNQEIDNNITQSGSEDFNLFFKKFNADAAFQISRVKFPFKVIELPDTEEEKALVHIVPMQKWKQINLLPGGTILMEKHWVNKTTVKVQLMVEDTGVLVFHYFKCLNGKWWLDHAEDASD